MDFGDNIWDVQFDPPDDWSEAAAKAGFGPVRGKRLRRQLGATLSSALWELDPASAASGSRLSPATHSPATRAPTRARRMGSYL